MFIDFYQNILKIEEIKNYLALISFANLFLLFFAVIFHSNKTNSNALIYC